MESRLWLDNVETPNRQSTKIDTSPNILNARCTHSEVELRKCCLGQSEKSEIPYLIIYDINLKLFWEMRLSFYKYRLYIYKYIGLDYGV